MVQQHTWYGMLCSNFHIYHRLLKNQKIKKQKTFPYLPTHKLKNKLETDLFFSRPKRALRNACLGSDAWREKMGGGENGCRYNYISIFIVNTQSP